MPYAEQLGRSKKKTWEEKLIGNGKFAKNIVNLFGDDKEIEFSRADLFESAKNDDLDNFLAKVIVWGYPRGPRGDNFSSICKNIGSIKKLLTSANKGISDWQSHFDKLSKIDGIGMSTYTKFLYFKRVKIGELPALILDIQVINALKRDVFLELKEISNIRNSNAHKFYPNYLACAHNIATKFDTDADRVEMFLFQYGDSLKT